jgi:hypothetical protein
MYDIMPSAEEYFVPLSPVVVTPRGNTCILQTNVDTLTRSRLDSVSSEVPMLSARRPPYIPRRLNQSRRPYATTPNLIWLPVTATCIGEVMPLESAHLLMPDWSPKSGMDYSRRPAGGRKNGRQLRPLGFRTLGWSFLKTMLHAQASNG